MNPFEAPHITCIGVQAYRIIIPGKLVEGEFLSMHWIESRPAMYQQKPFTDKILEHEHPGAPPRILGQLKLEFSQCLNEDGPLPYLRTSHK